MIKEEPTEPPGENTRAAPPEEAALGNILQRRLKGRFVASEVMRDRVEAMIADKRRR